MKRSFRAAALIPALLMSASLGGITYYGFSGTLRQSNTTEPDDLDVGLGTPVTRTFSHGSGSGVVPTSRVAPRAFDLRVRKPTIAATADDRTLERRDSPSPSLQDPRLVPEDQADRLVSLREPAALLALNVIPAGLTPFQQVPIEGNFSSVGPFTQIVDGFDGGFGGLAGSSNKAGAAGGTGNPGPAGVPGNSNAGGPSNGNVGALAATNIGGPGVGGPGVGGPGVGGPGVGGPGGTNLGAPDNKIVVVPDDKGAIIPDSSDAGIPDSRNVGVPEPDVLVLLLSGAIGLWFTRRRQCVNTARAKMSATIHRLT